MSRALLCETKRRHGLCPCQPAASAAAAAAALTILATRKEKNESPERQRERERDRQADREKEWGKNMKGLVRVNYMLLAGHPQFFLPKPARLVDTVR